MSRADPANVCVRFRVYQYTTLMRTNRRAVFFSVALFSAAVCVLGFGVALPAAPPKDAPAGKNVPRKNLDTALSVGSTDFSAALPDPKRPGKLLYELRAKSFNGQSVGGQLNGSLTSIWARLYQNGVPGAVLTAPHAQGRSAGKSVIVTGTDGVVVKSLTEPGTEMTADTMAWYANENRIVATGHVFYRNGKDGATMHAPRMEANTGLKTIHVTGGGQGTVAF